MPRKSKGRGKGFGRGRGRESQEDETRPGEKQRKSATQRTSEGNSSFHQDPVHSMPSQTSQETEQETEKRTSVQKVQSSETISPSCSKSPSSSTASGGILEDVVRKSRDQKGEQQPALTYQTQKVASNVREEKVEKGPSADKKVRSDTSVKASSTDEVVTRGLKTLSSGPSADKKVRSDASVKASSTAAVTHGLKALSLGAGSTDQVQADKRLRPPSRPDFGTVGKPINLYANSFELKVPPKQFMYHYDVEIEPNKCPQRVNQQIIDALFKRYGKEKLGGARPAFDGKKNIYSCKKLPVEKDGVTFNVCLPDEDGGKDRNFKVKIKFVAYVNMQDLDRFLKGELPSGKLPQDSIQALDVALRQQPSLLYLPVGRSTFFPPPGTHYPPADLGGGCEIWFGYHQSVRPSEWKTLLVNIDVSAKGFYKEQDMIAFMCETLNLRDPSRRIEAYMREKLEASVKGLRIQTDHLKYKRKYYVTGVSSKSANQHQFVVENSGVKSTTSVEKYFKEQYGIKLSYPELPCLHVGKDRYLPIEVCKLVPCQKRKLTEMQVAAMIKKTARPPRERKEKIECWARTINQNSGQYLWDEFGMRMSTDMVKIQGRILPAPTIQLEQDPNDKSEHPKHRSIVPRDGSWNMNRNSFYKGSVVEHWALFCYVDQRFENDIKKFIFQLQKFSRERGVVMKDDPCVKRYLRGERQTEFAFDAALKENRNIQLFIAIIPDKGSTAVYESIKQAGDVHFGVPTQCVKLSRVQKPSPSLCANIALKINAKMGGVNHVVNPQIDVAPVFTKPVIIFGADVTHPSPGDMKTPSIAAVVGSLDRYASRYCARIRIQKNREEIIQDLANVVKEIFIQFYRYTRGQKPAKIVFYRDGVSEGQFDQVLLHEVRAVQQACVMLEKGYKPGITFAVVQKRHHARLFPADDKDACGRQGNVPPGTTVDTIITHPFEFDFYLCSHQGIQGTSKPTHYHVLYDDNRFTADSLQQLTYQLCHSFARCTKSVSMPAPAYYAHLAAFRARNHLADLPKQSEEDTESFRAAVKVNKKMMSEMYFT